MKTGFSAQKKLTLRLMLLPMGLENLLIIYTSQMTGEFLEGKFHSE